MGKLKTPLVLSLCALFLALAMGAALLSAQVYRGVNEAGQRHSVQRTALLYLTNQIKNARDRGGVPQILPFGDADGIWLYEGCSAYATVLYCHNGALMELYADTALELGPEAGQEILPLGALSVIEEGDLLKLTVTDTQGNVYGGEVSWR